MYIWLSRPLYYTKLYTSMRQFFFLFFVYFMKDKEEECLNIYDHYSKKKISPTPVISRL